MHRIYGFDGTPYEWLSNFSFFPITINLEGIEITVPTNENGFVAAKTTDPALRRKIATLFPDEPEKIKRFGRTKLNVRQDWQDICTPVMRYLVYSKIRQHTHIQEWLLATGTMPIFEANTWGDGKWGVDAQTGEGENRLGHIWEDGRELLVQGTFEFV